MYCIRNGELYHFGIPGMRWGKRNGPPYPLSREQASSTEKRKPGYKEAPSLKKDYDNKRNKSFHAFQKNNSVDKKDILKEISQTEKELNKFRSEFYKNFNNEKFRKAYRDAQNKLEDLNTQRAESTTDADEAAELANEGIRSKYYRDEHTVPKGTIITRSVEESRAGDLKEGPTYVTYLDRDNDFYASYFDKRSNGKAVQMKFELTKDLKVPSRDELRQTISETVKEHPEIKKEIVDGVFDYFFNNNDVKNFILDEYNMNEGKALKNHKELVDDIIKTKLNGRKIDDVFSYTTQSFAASPKVKNLVIEKLKTKGFNAMTDEAGVGGKSFTGEYRECVDPLIVFDSSVLKKVGEQKLSSSDIDKVKNNLSEFNRNRSKNSIKNW